MTTFQTGLPWPVPYQCQSEGKTVPTVQPATPARLVTRDGVHERIYAATNSTAAAIADAIGNRDMDDAALLVALLRLIDGHFVDQGDENDVEARLLETRSLPEAAQAMPAPAAVSAAAVVEMLHRGRRDHDWCGAIRQAAEAMGIDYDAPAGNVPKRLVRSVASRAKREHGYVATINSYLRELGIDPDGND